MEDGCWRPKYASYFYPPGKGRDLGKEGKPGNFPSVAWQMQQTKIWSGFIAPQSALNRMVHYLVGALQLVAWACFPVLGPFMSPGQELPEGEILTGEGNREVL